MTISVKLNIPIKSAVSTLTHHLNILQKERGDFEHSWRITGEPGLQYYVFPLNSPNDPILKVYCEIRLREMGDAKTDFTVFDPEWASYPPYMVFRSSLKKEELIYLEKTQNYDFRADQFEKYVHLFNKRKDSIIKALIKRLKSDGVLENNVQKEFDNSFSVDEAEIVFVSQTRIRQLKRIKSKQYDLKKLIRLCEELNHAYMGKCYLSVALLLRAIIDHVPPILGFSKFTEVANNYSGGGRSLRENFQHLENSSRKIADRHIHSIIRDKEGLPTKQQVDFKADLDVLLDELIRISK